jgi:hypothetical protein
MGGLLSKWLYPLFHFYRRNEIAAGQSDPSVRLDWERVACKFGTGETSARAGTPPAAAGVGLLREVKSKRLTRATARAPLSA